MPLLRLSWPWGYQDTEKRDLRWDFLRGYALLGMIVVHTIVGRSFFFYFVLHEPFFLTPPEIFYFMFGLVLGLASARRQLSAGLVRTFRRTVQLYLVTVGMALGFLILGLATNLRLWHDAQKAIPSGDKLITFIANLFTLHNSFHGTHILALFVVFMLFAPLAIWACFEGRGWMVLVVSGLVYALSQVVPQAVRLPVDVFFFPAACQTLYFTGLVMGFHWKEVSRFIARVPLFNWLGVAVLVLAIFFFVLYVADFPIWPDFLEQLGQLSRLRPQMLLFIALYLAAAMISVTWFWKPLHRFAGWLLIPLGQNALWGYVAHLVIIVLFYNLPVFSYDSTVWAGTLWHALSIALILLSISLKDRLTKPKVSPLPPQ